VPVDREGNALANALIWMDARGASYIRSMIGGPLRIDGYAPSKLISWVRLTGGVPTRSGKDSIAHVLFLKHEYPEVYRQTYKFLEPKDYLNLRLTGRFAASTESITMHWLTDNRDLARVDYAPKLLSLCDVEREKFPDLKPAVDVLGPLRPQAAAELGLHEDVPVVMGTPDLHSAALGSGAILDYDAHLYLGTSSWLTCHLPYKKTDVLHNMAALPSALPDRYFVVNEQECAGSCVAYLIDSLLYPQDSLDTGAKPADVHARIERLAATAAPGSDKLIFAPWLYGERTPVDDHTVRGGFFNQSLQTTRAQLVRAVFEGVAYNSRWLLTYVERFVKRRLDSIRLIGGGAQSELWCQIHADVLNRTILQVADPLHANVRGAAYLAAVALGQLSFSDIPSRVPIAHTFEPNPTNRAIYDELFREFIAIYKDNRRIYARLNAKSNHAKDG
jgi:xylulokinase